MDADNFPALRAKYDELSTSGASDMDIMRAMQDEMSKADTSTRTGGRTRNRNKNVFRPGIRMSALRQSSRTLMFTPTAKDSETVKQLRKALQSTLFSMDEQQAVNTVIDAMKQKSLEAGTELITQGKEGAEFSVMLQGQVEVVIDGEAKKTLDAPCSFGELALIYDQPASATIRACADVIVWSLDAQTFRNIQAVTASNSISQRATWLKRVPLLQGLSNHDLSRVANALGTAEYAPGDVIVRQGDAGDKFYIIEKGEVAVHQKNKRRQSLHHGDGSSTDIAAAAAAGGGAGASEKASAAQSEARAPRSSASAEFGDEVDRIGEGSHFGEMALMSTSLRGSRPGRNATVVAVGAVRVLTMHEDEFHSVMGDVEEAMARQQLFHSLRKNDAFKGLGIEALRSLVRDLQERSFAAGDTIARAGEVAEGVYIVQGGDVHCLEPGGGALVAEMETGGSFGELSVASAGGEPEPYDVAAVSDARCMFLPATMGKQILGVPTQGSDGGAAGVVAERMCEGPMSRLALGDLRQLALLGEGSFGRVTLMEATHPDSGERVPLALKRMCKQHILDDGQHHHIKSEREILASLRPHPFLLHLFATFQDRDCVYLLTNTLVGGELFSMLHPEEGDNCLSVADASFYAANVFLAVEHLHRSDVIYRDMKPENILFNDSGYLVLIDMGFAKRVPYYDDEEQREHDVTYTMCGTPEYMAPEFILQTGHNAGVDLWAFGVLVFEMMFGVTPFLPEDEDMGELFKNIARVRTSAKKGRSRPTNLPFPRGFEREQPHATDFILGLLDGDPTNRLGMRRDGEREIREHPFFGHIDWSALVNKEIKPPYQPKVRDAFDTSNFDAEESGDLDVTPLIDAEEAETIFADF